MKRRLRLPLLAACLAAPLPLLAQVPAAPPPAANPAAAPAADSKPAGETKADVDPATVDAIRKAFAAQRAKGSYRARMESSGLGGGAVPVVEMEFVLPNRMRMKMAEVEVISVGDKTMMKMGEGWMPAPAAMKGAGSSFGDEKKVEEMLAGVVLAKSLGPTKIDGIAVDSYQLNAKTKEGLSKSKIYLLPASGLIQRMETEAEVMGQNATSRLDYYDYGAPIRIELPK